MQNGTDLYVRLFGVPMFEGSSVPTAFPDKGFQLLAFLCAAQDHRCLRAQAAKLLWGADGLDRSRANLRQLLARIRHRSPAGQQIVGADGREVFLIRPEGIDLSLFLAAARKNTPQSDVFALNLHAGTLLATVQIDASDFSVWLVDLRDRISIEVLEIGKRVLAAVTQYGHASLEETSLLCQKLTLIDPHREDIGRAVIKAYSRIGAIDHVEAAFSALADAVLRKDNRPLSAETIALVRRARAGSHRSFENPPVKSSHSEGNGKPRLAILRPRDTSASTAASIIDGLVNELAFELAKYRSFVVLAPYSSFAVADTFGLPADNGTLRADYVIAGDIRDEGDGPSLRLRLTIVESREIVWSGKFAFSNETLGKCLWSLTQRIVASIASEIERHKLTSLRAMPEPSAFLHFLEGRALQSRCDLPFVRKARSRFLQATAADDRFAQAHARIAETLYVEWILCGGSDPALLTHARKHAMHAIGLEPADATGHWVSGAVALYQRKFDLVEDAFRVAESLCPNNADLLLEFGDALSHLGTHDEAEQKFLRAIDLNPVPPDRYWWFGASIAFNRLDFSTAAERCAKLGNKDVALGLRTASNALVGNADAARYWARRLKQALPGLAVEDLVRISPDRDGTQSNAAYIEGLRLAGIM